MASSGQLRLIKKTADALIDNIGIGQGSRKGENDRLTQKNGLLSSCAWRRADFEQRSKSHRRSAPDVGPGRADPCAQSDAASAVTKARAMAQAGENSSGRTMPPHIPPLRSLTYCISTNYSTIPPIPPFSCGVVAYIYSSAAPVSEVSHFVLACRNSSDQAGSLLAPQSYGRHFARTRE
jgi:hypothetical protein